MIYSIQLTKIILRPNKLSDQIWFFSRSIPLICSLLVIFLASLLYNIKAEQQVSTDLIFLLVIKAPQIPIAQLSLCKPSPPPLSLPHLLEPGINVRASSTQKKNRGGRICGIREAWRHLKSVSWLKCCSEMSPLGWPPVLIYASGARDAFERWERVQTWNYRQVVSA